MNEILPHLESTYKSIDLSIACVFYEGKWLNFYTMLRFTHESVSSLNQQILENNSLIQLSNGTGFRLYRKPFVLDELPDLIRCFNTGSIEINGETIYYEPMNIEQPATDFRKHSSGGKKWGEFFVFRSDKSGMPHKQPSFYNSLTAEVIPYGAKNIFKIIQHFFDLPEYHDNYTVDFTVAAPVYARIENIELEGRKIKVTVRYHKDLTGLFLHYGRYRSMNLEDMLEPKVYNQSKGTTTEENNFKIWQIETDELDITGQSYEDISCDVSLFHQPLSEEVSSAREFIPSMIAEKKLLTANPLAKILAKFCPIEEVQKMLTNPTNVRVSGLTLSDTSNFERMVQWLFALCGFSAVWLGNDMETVRDEQNRPSGSADLLCYSAKEKALAVVNCKTGVPDDKAIDSIKNLVEKFRAELDELEIRVVPIIISSQSCDTVKENGLKNNVDIIDVNDIQRIVERLYEGPPTPGLLLRTIRTSSTIGI